jgi:hypothetical protein
MNEPTSDSSGDRSSFLRVRTLLSPQIMSPKMDTMKKFTFSKTDIEASSEIHNTVETDDSSDDFCAPVWVPDSAAMQCMVRRFCCQFYSDLL